MSDRKRKKAARNTFYRLLCVDVQNSDAWPCTHDTAYKCRAQDRRDRRVLGFGTWWWGAEHDVIQAVISKTQPARLWMPGGARYHQRYLNRRKRR